jgi:histidine triad (HIT) family protein
MAETETCIFCRILAGSAPASFVYRDEQVAAFMAVPQAGPGHVLVVPIAHYENAYDLPSDLAGPVLSLGLRLARAVKRGLGPDGITMVQNSEAGASQTVFHFHLHVIARIAGQPISIHHPPRSSRREDLDRLAEIIRRALNEEV